jgi:hypothetical protein
VFYGGEVAVFDIPWPNQQAGSVPT